MQDTTDYHSTTKCAAINYNTVEKATIADGTEVPIEEKVMYLGSIISKDHNHRKEVASRKAAAMATWKKLAICWNKNRLSTKNQTYSIRRGNQK